MSNKQKGKDGEEEACRWIQTNIFDNRRLVEVNRKQVHIGCDILSKPFIFEVKRQEQLVLNGWWIQVIKARDTLASFENMYIPVVMFRQNRGNWEFLISAEVIGDDTGFVRLTEQRFKTWARRYVEG